MKTLPAAVLLSFAAALVAQSPAAAPKAPPKDVLAKAWQRAVELSRKHKAPILAFVLPPEGARADEQVVAATRAAEKKVWMLTGRGGAIAPAMTTQRDVLLRRVQLLRGSQQTTFGTQPKASDEQVLFALTVPVFARADACGAEQGENVVLLAPQGERIAGFSLDLLDGEAFVREVGAQVLAEHALEPRLANVPAQARAGLQRWRELQNEDTSDLSIEQRRELWQEAQQLEKQLTQDLVAVGPLLVRRRGADEEGGDGIAAAAELWQLETSRPPLGSAAHVAERDPCMGCGMGYTPPGLLTTLKLIGP